MLIILEISANLPIYIKIDSQINNNFKHKLTNKS